MKILALSFQNHFAVAIDARMIIISLVILGKLPTLPGKGILVINKGKDAVYFMEEKWMEEAQKRPLGEIISSEAVRILKEK